MIPNAGNQILYVFIVFDNKKQTLTAMLPTGINDPNPTLTIPS